MAKKWIGSSTAYIIGGDPLDYRGSNFKFLEYPEAEAARKARPPRFAKRSFIVFEGTQSKYKLRARSNYNPRQIS